MSFRDDIFSLWRKTDGGVVCSSTHTPTGLHVEHEYYGGSLESTSKDRILEENFRYLSARYLAVLRSFAPALTKHNIDWKLTENSGFTILQGNWKYLVSSIISDSLEDEGSKEYITKEFNQKLEIMLTELILLEERNLSS